MIIGKVVFTDLSSMIQDLMSGIIQYEETFRNWIANNIPAGLVSEKFTEFTNYMLNWLSENISATSVIQFSQYRRANVVNVV